MEYMNTLPSFFNEINAQVNTIQPTTDTISTAVGVGIATFILILLFVMLCISLALCVVQIISLWKIFTKANEKGWKALIPIYNLVVLYRLSGISPLLILIYAIVWVPFIGPISALVLRIYLSHNLAKSFGKDIGYTVGLTVPSTSWIFYLILGLGKDEYVGPGGNATATVATESASNTKTVKAQVKAEPEKVSTTKKATSTKSASAKKPAAKKTTTKKTASTTKTNATKPTTTKKSSTSKKPTAKKASNK